MAKAARLRIVSDMDSDVPHKSVNDQSAKPKSAKAKSAKAKSVKIQRIPEIEAANDTSKPDANLKSGKAELNKVELNKVDDINANSLCIEASEDIVKTVNELKRLQDLKEKLEKLENNYKLKVMDFMQLNQELKHRCLTLVTWKGHMRKSFDSQGFRSEFPDLYSSYLKEMRVRVFKVC